MTQLPPSSDFPAAHSMDTTWFAIDRDGHVAVFDSGEAGAVPVGGYTEDPAPILDELVKAAGGDDIDWDELPERLPALGIYFYAHEEWENALAGPYDRTGVPSAPMPGDRVPRGLLTHMVSFDGRFAEMPRLQPAEHWPSDAWSAAWIASDGESVHCVPGHEDEYARHLDELRQALDGRPLKIAAPKPPAQARALPRKRWWQLWKK